MAEKNQMTIKYVVNNTGIAYNFSEPDMPILKANGYITISPSRFLEVKENNFFFKALFESKAIGVYNSLPSNLKDVNAQLAEDDAEIRRLREQNAKLESKLQELGALGEETSTVLNTDSIENNSDETVEVKSEETEQNTTSKPKAKAKGKGNK